MVQLKILVVDDDRDVCEYLSDFLNREGYQVTTITDPTEALDELKRTDYHLVVLDLKMPKMTGIDLLQQIRRVDGDVAVVILTGHPSLETATASIQHDVSAYLKKPFTSEEFREVLQRIAKKKGLILRREDELRVQRAAEEQYRKVLKAGGKGGKHRGKRNPPGWQCSAAASRDSARKRRKLQEAAAAPVARTRSRAEVVELD